MVPQHRVAIYVRASILDKGQDLETQLVTLRAYAERRRFVTVMTSIVQFERSLISERVKAGMARAKAQGKRISRLPIPKPLQARIAALPIQRYSIQQISAQLSISYGTAWNYVQRCKPPTTGALSRRRKCLAGCPKIEIPFADADGV